MKQICYTHQCIHGQQTRTALICRIHPYARCSQDPEIIDAYETKQSLQIFMFNHLKTQRCVNTVHK